MTTYTDCTDKPATTYFHGVYRIMAIAEKTCRTRGKVYLRFTLSNAEETINGYLPKDSEIPTKHLEYLSIVIAEGYSKVHEDTQKEVFHLEDLRIAPNAHLHRYPKLIGLPKSLGHNEAVTQLFMAVNKLEHSVIKDFIANVLENADIFVPFITKPASKNYHHNGMSGLLTHSLETAQEVSELVARHEPEQGSFYQELGFLAGLFHDIGKIYMYDDQKIALLVNHDSLTLELCSPGLAVLSKQHLDAANMLRHVWTVRNDRYAPKTEVSLTRYLKFADGDSASADNRRLAFGNTDKAYATLGKNRYWRLVA